MKKSEYDAIEWWNLKLVNGEILPIVGGSDSHKNELSRIIGAPTTFIYSDSRGKSDILRAIRSGHVFISYNVNGPIIEFSIGNAIMGDCVSFREKQTGLVRVHNVCHNDIIKLITERGIEKTYEVLEESTKAFSFKIDERKFYRIEVWREALPQMPVLVSIANPIYISK